MVLDVLLQPKEFVTTTENEEGKEMVGVIEAVVAEVFQTYVYPAAATALIVTVAGSAHTLFGPVITANGRGGVYSYSSGGCFHTTICIRNSKTHRIICSCRISDQRILITVEFAVPPPKPRNMKHRRNRKMTRLFLHTLEMAQKFLVLVMD